MKNKLLKLIMLFSIITSLASAQCQIVNLAGNGNFSLGNTGFTSNVTAGAGCSAQTYTVNSNFQNKCAAWDNVTGNTIAGANNFLIVDGLNGAVGNSAVWSQTVTVCAQRTYTFSFWSRRVHDSAVEPMNLTMTIVGTGMGAPPNVITSNLSRSMWHMHQRVWTAPITGTVQIQIRQNSFVASGKRDFGIDDVTFRACCPAISTASSVNICSGNCVTLTATGANSYTWMPGGVTGPSVAVCPSVTTTYTVSGLSGSCVSCLVTSTVVVNVTPSATLTPDFILSGTGTATNSANYLISAIPLGTTSWPTSSFWWEISEVDVPTGTSVINTMTNAQTWWYNPFIGNNTFPGYDYTLPPSSWPVSSPMAPYPSPYTGTSFTTNPPAGNFQLGKRYRITRATWGDCISWTTMSKSIYMCSGCKGSNGPVFIIENDSYSPAMPKELAMKTNIQSAKSIDKQMIVISPNPNNGVFDMTMDSESVKDIYVYDIAGKVVYENKGVAERNINININDQPKGIYIVRVTDGKISNTQKIIKE
ncbi:MAG: T9SS type A sorting domain-containing protein [Bacteroidota bacterium]|nr:T9SS type A sorting domain-containing protein [Bacteroidota bacterium]